MKKNYFSPGLFLIITAFFLISGYTAQGSSFYTINSIAYSPVAGSGSVVSLSDDAVSSALPIGFTFEFYDNPYTSFYISSNGFITFTSGSGSGCCSGQLLPDPLAPNNLVAFAWSDLYPPGNGTVEYFTTGTAPNRRLIVNFIDIPYCCGTTPAVRTQVVLYETTNVIEIHTNYINSISSGTMGIENIDGTVADVVTGRNQSNWSASNEGVQFNPVCSGLIVDAGTDQNVCSSASVTLGGAPTATGGSGNYSYLWSPSTGLNNSASANPTATVTSTTTYTVTVTDVSNGCAISDDVKITVTPSMNVMAEDNSICIGESTILSAVGENAEDNFDAGLNGTLWADTVSVSLANSCGSVNGNALHFIYSSASGRYAETNALNTVSGGTIDFYLTNANGICNAAESGEELNLEYSTDGGSSWNIINSYSVFSYPSFTLISEPIPSAAQTSGTKFRWIQYFYSGSNMDIWIVDELAINASTNTGNYSYSWSPAESLDNSTAANPIATPDTTTTYSVTVTDNTTSCQGTGSVTVVVNSLPSANAGSDILLCEGEGFQLQGSATGGTGVYTYSWSPKSGISDTSIANPILTGTTSNIYTFCATDANDCRECDEIFVTVVQTDTPVANFAYTPDDFTYSFVNLSSGASDLDWDFGDGSKSTQVNPTHTYSSNGTYNVTLKAMNTCGSTVLSSEKTISVRIATGIKEKDAFKDLKIYPNPAKQSLNISFYMENNEDTHIEVLDLLGKVVKSDKIKSQGKFTHSLDINSLSDGVYFIRIANGDASYISKFVKN